MSNRIISPIDVYEPQGHYSHAVEISPGARLVYVSGQIGTRLDGSMPDNVGEQTELALTNLINVLKSASMDISNIVKLNAYLTSQDDVQAYAEARSSFQGPHKPASTLAIVAALALPEYLVEIEAVAAKSL